MKINMNKDFEQAFPDEAFGGFTLKQCLTAAAGILAAGITVISLQHVTGLGIVECTYIGIPVMIPVCILGFYKYQGQSPLQMLKEMRYMKGTRLLLHEAEEYKEEYQRVLRMERTEIRYKKGRRKQKDGSH